jgi:hypothetical protein
MASVNTLERRMRELAAEGGIHGLSPGKLRKVLKRHRDTYRKLMSSTRVETANARPSDSDDSGSAEAAPSHE